MNVIATSTLINTIYQVYYIIYEVTIDYNGNRRMSEVKDGHHYLMELALDQLVTLKSMYPRHEFVITKQVEVIVATTRNTNPHPEG